MRAVLDGLLAAPKAEVAAPLKPAFDRVIAGKARLALAGSLAEAQRQLFAPAINEELQRLRQNQGDHPGRVTYQTWLELLAAQFAIKSYVAQLTDELRLVVEGTCADAAAAGIAAKVNLLDQQLRDGLGKDVAKWQAGPMAGMYGKLDVTKPLLEAKAADGQVVVTVNALQGSSISLLSLLFMGGLDGGM
jgi:hypothetical protein